LLGMQPQADIAHPPRTFIADNTAIHLNHDPSVNRMLVDEAAERFSIPDLRDALAEYLHRARSNPDTYYPIGGQRKTRDGTSLPFDYLQVWYKLRLQHHSYHDPSTLIPAETVNAMPPNNAWPEGRFDAMAICIDDGHHWPESGLQGASYINMRSRLSSNSAVRARRRGTASDHASRQQAGHDILLERYVFDVCPPFRSYPTARRSARESDSNANS
jgi:hypothetical protein